MFTWHHGFWLYFFTRKHKQVWQFVAGSMLPDYIYFVATILLITQEKIKITDFITMKPAVFIAHIQHYPWISSIDLLGHSVVIWSFIFLVTLIPGNNKLQPFVIGWGTHLIIDIFTHGKYAIYFLYPLSMVAIHSPLSYWEPEYFATEFKIVNYTLMITAASYMVYKWWQNKQKGRD